MSYIGYHTGGRRTVNTKAQASPAVWRYEGTQVATRIGHRRQYLGADAHLEEGHDK